jgi:hypothetical protein
MAIEKYSYLTPEQRTHFLEHGWVRIPKAITPENIAKFSDDVWVRLGYDKDDMSTWKEEKVQRSDLTAFGVCRGDLLIARDRYTCPDSERCCGRTLHRKPGVLYVSPSVIMNEIGR